MLQANNRDSNQGQRKLHSSHFYSTVIYLINLGLALQSSLSLTLTLTPPLTPIARVIVCVVRSRFHFGVAGHSVHFFLGLFFCNFQTRHVDTGTGLLLQQSRTNLPHATNSSPVARSSTHLDESHTITSAVVRTESLKFLS